MSFILHVSLSLSLSLRVHFSLISVIFFLAHVIHPSCLSLSLRVHFSLISVIFFLAHVIHPSCLSLSLRVHFSLIYVIFFLAHILHPSCLSLYVSTSLQPYLCDLLLSTCHSSFIHLSLRLHVSLISVIFFLAHVIHPTCLSLYVRSDS